MLSLCRSYVMLAICAVVLMTGLTGCGKTLGELRADKDAIVDNGGSMVKKALDAVLAIYDIGKKAVEDTKDNFVVVKDTVTGAPATAPAPTK